MSCLVLPLPKQHMNVNKSFGIIALVLCMQSKTDFCLLHLGVKRIK